MLVESAMLEVMAKLLGGNVCTSSVQVLMFGKKNGILCNLVQNTSSLSLSLSLSLSSTFSLPLSSIPPPSSSESVFGHLHVFIERWSVHLLYVLITWGSFALLLEVAFVTSYHAFSVKSV